MNILDCIEKSNVGSKTKGKLKRLEVFFTKMYDVMFEHIINIIVNTIYIYLLNYLFFSSFILVMPVIGLQIY